MSWELDNVYERNKESPYTFYIPSKQVIDILGVGDIVKLIFLGESEHDGLAGERMWVEITERNDGDFKGLLTNEPYDLKNLVVGQEVVFKVDHICDTEYEDPTSSNWNYYFDTKVIVSRDVLDKREFNFLLRDNPNNEQDSGWTVFSGYEENDFLSDSTNFQPISIGVILNIDDSILSILDERPLCAFERNEEGLFEEIDDYDWDTYLNS